MIYDVAIVGSGPSGASTAFYLASKGLKCIIIEKEELPRYKTCGGGFVFRGRKDMPFDIDTVIEREFRSVDIHFDSMKLFFKTERQQPIVSMVMRDAFDHLIVRRAQELGVELFQGEALEQLKLGETAELRTTTKLIRSRFVIGADGALSQTAKLAGWKETRRMCPALEYELKVSCDEFDRLSQKTRFDIDAAPFGYGWCFPKKEHLSVGVGNFRKNKKQPELKKCYHNYLNTIGIKNIIASSAHGFIIPTSPRQDGFVKQNVFLIGDAAGFADPLTAEGISNAIYSGKLAAEAIADSNMELENAKTNYKHLLNKKLLPELKTGDQLAKLFYENKTLRNLVLKHYGRNTAELMTDIFMGKRSYPHDYKQKIRTRLKTAVFS